MNHRWHASEIGVDPSQSEPWYRLSVFIADQEGDEDEVSVLQRLIGVAAHAGIRIDDPRNAGFWVARLGAILDAGFLVTKDGYSGEPPEHYSVDIGPTEPDNDRVKALMRLFDGPRDTEEVVRR